MNTPINSDDIRKAKLKRLYRWGIAGLIPNFGLIVGLVLLTKGVVRYRDRKLILIGVLDILATIVFIVGMKYEAGHGDLFESSTFAQSELNTLVKSVEFYKIQNGSYPDSLEQVENIQGMVWINDPLLMTEDNKKKSQFHYKKIRDKYTIFSVGIDRKPHTTDDIYPTVTKGDTIKFGFVKE